MDVSQLQQMNSALLMKRWWKLLDNLNTTVCHILRKKYNRNSDKWADRDKIRTNTSQFWKGLQETKGIFWAGLKFTLGDGERISFWRDKWMDLEKLRDAVP